MRAAKIAFLFALSVMPFFLPRFSMAQLANPNFWITDGTVRATALSGNTLYIGGDFSYVGPNNGGFARLDATSGMVVPGSHHVNGTVYAVAPDGHGGWFIGGSFEKVGDEPRSNLAHFRSDGTLDGWNPGADGPVLAL